MKDCIGRTVQTINSGVMVVKNTIGKIGKIIRAYDRGPVFIVQLPNGYILELEESDFCFVDENGKFEGFYEYKTGTCSTELDNMAEAMYVNLSNNINIGQIRFPKWEDLTPELRESYTKTILFLRKIHTVNNSSLSEILECAKTICEKEILNYQLPPPVISSTSSCDPTYAMSRVREKIMEAEMWLNTIKNSKKIQTTEEKKPC